MKNNTQGPKSSNSHDPNPVLTQKEKWVYDIMMSSSNVLNYWKTVEPKIFRIELQEIMDAEAAGRKFLKIVVKNILQPESVTLSHTTVKNRSIRPKINVDDIVLHPSSNYEISDRNAVAITPEIANRYKTISFVCPLEFLRRRPETRVYFYTLSKFNAYTAILCDFYTEVSPSASVTRGAKIPSSAIIE